MKALISIEGESMKEFKRLIRNDEGWAIGFYVTYDNGQVVDLTASTVQFKTQPTLSGGTTTTPTEDSNALTLPTTGSTTEKRGFQFSATNECQLTSVEKSNDSTSTRAELLDDGTQNIIATATFVGNVATFSPQPTLIAGETYRLTTDDSTASYTDASETGVTFPIAGTNISYLQGVEGSNGQTLAPTTGYNILAITTSITGYTAGLKIDGTCALTAPAAGLCEYTLQTGDLDTAGNYNAELEVTLSGGAIHTVSLGKLEVIEDLE